jgi:hypothetical protein
MPIELPKMHVHLHPSCCILANTVFFWMAFTKAFIHRIYILTDTAFFRKYHTQALSQCLANVYSMYESFGKGHPEEHSICQDAARGV